MIPEEIKNRMMDCQEEQGNPRNWSVFEEALFNNKGVPTASKGGFDFRNTLERKDFWARVIYNPDYDFFFKRYPKEELTFPRKMLVWDDWEKHAKPWTVICKSRGGYISVSAEQIDCFEKGIAFRATQWKNAKEIPKPKETTPRKSKINASYLLGGYQKVDKK